MTENNPFSLAGHTVLVTGASSGIGRATAIECARLGATIVATARNEERLRETMQALSGTGHRAITAELTDPEQLQRLVAECPPLHGLAHCAGRGDTTPFLFITREKMEQLFAVNLYAPVELLRQLVKKKKLGRGASAVVVSSVADRFNDPGNGVYCAAKAALSALVRSAGLELAPRGIRVNAVCPAMIDTPLIHGGSLSEADMQADMKNYPLGRYGRPEEVAWAIAYLLSEASTFTTAHTHVIDGGRRPE